MATAVENTPKSNKKWKSETSAAVKRIIIGVVTAVATSSVIYFLGFNRPKPRASEIEIKKNTIRVWKEFVDLENKLQPKHDSSFARSVRGEITIPELCRQDSLISVGFIQSVEELKQTPAIDDDMVLLLRDRINFKQEELDRFLEYARSFQAISDTVIREEYKNFLLNDLSRVFVGRRENGMERMGRSMNDMLQFLQKKYKYPFQLKDINWYEQFLQLKAVREVQIKPDNTPPPLQ